MKIRKDIIGFTIPVIMEQAFVLSLGMINTIMAGHLGKEAVSAIGMVDSINIILISFFSALAVGGTVVIAHYYGQRNVSAFNNTSKQILYVGVLLAIFITLMIWIFKYPIIHFLFGSAENTVINYSISYLGITLITYPFIAMELIISGSLRGIGNTKTPMKVNIFMNIINVIMSYILIYGIDIRNQQFHLTVTGHGVLGAAFGIAIARVSGAVISLFIILRGTSNLKLKHPLKFKFDKVILKSIFGIGIPAGLESLLFNGGKLITQVYIVGLGTDSIAANYIAGSVASIINIPGNAFCIAATAIVGQFFGKGNAKEAKNSLIYSTKLSTICLTVIGILVIPFANALAGLYTTNSNIIHIAGSLLRYNSIFLIIWSLSFVLPYGLKAAGDAKYTLITTIVGMWLFRIILGYILCNTLKLGVAGVWFGMFIDWAVRSILFLIRLNGNSWNKHSVIQKTT